MGDIFINSGILKELGFDGCNRWVLYEDGFKNFFSWFSENISEENILQQTEVYEEIELKQKGNYLKGKELNEKLEVFNKTYPSILNYSDEDIEIIQSEVNQLRSNEETYNVLINKMGKTKSKINEDIADLEILINKCQNQEKNSSETCIEKAKEIEELQKLNKTLCSDLNECFTKNQSPPLFMHQMPLDEYLVKCDLFLQHLVLYMKENFKIQFDLDDELEEEENKNLIKKFTKMKRQTIKAQTKIVHGEKFGYSLRKAIAELQTSEIYPINIAQLEKETRNFNHLLENSIIPMNDILENEIGEQFYKLASQNIDYIIHENNKIKLNRAEERLKNVKVLMKIVSDALTNGELLWILIQLDIEKVSKRYDNTEQLNNDYIASSKRIDIMREFDINSENYLSEIYMKKLLNISYNYLNLQKNSFNMKYFIYEYEKFGRSLLVYMQNICNQKFYMDIMSAIDKLNSCESFLKNILYNGPINRPVFENPRFNEQIYNAKRTKDSLEESIKQMKTDINENILEKMNSDRLWRNNQLLWVWFLEEPKKVLSAIEEVSKAASKASAGCKTLMGIKRQ